MEKFILAPEGEARLADMDVFAGIDLSGLSKVLVHAKLNGRRALSREELITAALEEIDGCNSSPWGQDWWALKREQRINARLDAGLFDGTFKLTAVGKIAIGKKREMKRAIAANGFERASDLPSEVLTQIFSFSMADACSLDITSRTISNLVPWRAVALSRLPALGLLVADGANPCAEAWW